MSLEGARGQISVISERSKANKIGVAINNELILSKIYNMEFKEIMKHGLDLLKRVQTIDAADRAQVRAELEVVKHIVEIFKIDNNKAILIGKKR